MQEHEWQSYVDQAFNRMDLDGDGFIDLDELLRWGGGWEGWSGVVAAGCGWPAWLVETLSGQAATGFVRARCALTYVHAVL
jgi:hypothetical protein